MKRDRLFLLILACLSNCPCPVRADDTPRPRRALLHPADEKLLSAKLQPIVAKLLSPREPAVDPDLVKPAGVFLRVVSRRHIFHDGKLRLDAWLGTRPFVFVTLPEIARGKTLLQLFSDIGYGADEVLGDEVGEEKVAIVFAYPRTIRLHEGTNGAIPAKFRRYVYPATWENLFGLVDRMVAGKDDVELASKEKPRLDRLLLKSEKERAFLLGYPDAGRKRLRTTSYDLVRETGGADWEYRRILQRTMSASDHYTGDGRLKRTYERGKKGKGYPEYLAPNVALRSLEEMAVIGLGKIQIVE